jgi:hypothetical protein
LIERSGGLAPIGKLGEALISRKLANPSPESVARANRQRLAQEEGARAMADVEQRAIAIRKNMERLRVLREAKEAQEGNARAAIPAVPKKKSKKVAAK